MEVFVENNYAKREVRMTVKDKEARNEEKEAPTTVHEVVLMLNIPQCTTVFSSIAQKHRFSMANQTTNKVRDLISNAIPLKD